MFFKGATCSALLKILRCRNMGAWHIQQMNGVGRMCNLWVFLSNFLDVLKMRIKKPEWKWTCEDYLRIIKKNKRDFISSCMPFSSNSSSVDRISSVLLRLFIVQHKYLSEVPITTSCLQYIMQNM